MSAVPKRPPRPSRPRSCHRDDSDVSSSVTAVDGTGLAICSDNENDQCTSSENTGTQNKLSIALDDSSTEAVTTTVEEVAVLSQCEEHVSDKVTTGSQSAENVIRPKVQECGKTETGVLSPAKTVVPVKPGVATGMIPADVKFRCSPKTRKAPPVPPPPTSKETRRLSADGERTLEMLPDDTESTNEPRRSVLRDLSPCNKCTSASSSSSVSNMDSKPALKPKPVTTVARESVGSDRVSYATHVVSASSIASEHVSSNSQQSSVTSNTVSASPPVYAVVSKSRTSRSTSNVDVDGCNVNKPSVARSKSAVASGSMPPKKPPRTFAHCEYMRLKSLSLPRSSGSDYEEVKATSANVVDATDPADNETNQDDVDGDVKVEVCESSEPVKKSKDCSLDGSSKDTANKTQDVSEKMKRRQTDKLPAPPRPPPPSFSDNRSSTVSPRSSVVDSATVIASPSEQEHSIDFDCWRQEHSSLLPEEKLVTTIRRESGSDVADDDDIVYAVPSDINCEVARRSHLTGISVATSEATETTLHPVGD